MPAPDVLQGLTTGACASSHACPQVLRNKARIIVDLQTLLPPSAMQDLQDACLGPFLHTLSASQSEAAGAPTLAKVDEW